MRRKLYSLTAGLAAALLLGQDGRQPGQKTGFLV